MYPAVFVSAFITTPVEPFCDFTYPFALDVAYVVLSTNDELYVPFLYVKLFVVVPFSDFEYPVVELPFAFPPVILEYELLKFVLSASFSIAFEPFAKFKFLFTH